MDALEVFLIGSVIIGVVVAIAGLIYLFINRKDNDEPEEMNGSIFKRNEENNLQAENNFFNEQKKKEQGQEDMRYPIALVREKSPYPAINNVRIRVTVDGEEISEISAGERQVISLPEGSHSICFSQKNGNKEVSNFYLGQNGVTATCFLQSKWNGIFVQAKVTNIFIDVTQNGNSREEKEKSSWWYQIPLLIRIVIWLFVIGFLIQFLIGFFWGISIGLS